MNINLKIIKHVHFIGIGGIGISAIARMILYENKKVSGQDLHDSDIIAQLRRAGAEIKIGQSLENIPQDVDLVVYTIAIENYDPVLFEKLKNYPCPIRSYPQMLSLVSENKYTIAVSGTHGKTTATAMIAKIMRDNDYDPTVIVGSLLLNEKSNFLAGRSNYFLVEACEYKRSFLNLNPKILVITNIDADHLDYYKDINDIGKAFRELVEKVPEDGYIVCNSKSPNVAGVVLGIRARIIDYKDFFEEKIKLKIPGLHNRENAAASRAVSFILGINNLDARRALEGFSGTWRRFEYKGLLSCGAKLYDDYAHHPKEVEATLQGFRELYPKENGWRLTVIFQPHLFSRTKALLYEFAKSFDLGNEVFLLPIFPAREKDDGTVSSFTLEKEILKNGNKAKAFANFREAENYLRKMKFNSRDILVTMGAGEAYRVGNNLLGL